MAIGVLLALAAGCGGRSGPYCASSIDEDGGVVPGSGVALCGDLREHPVCDAAGATARFERDATGRVQLIDGAYALCDAELTVVCPDRSVAPRCLREPD